MRQDPEDVRFFRASPSAGDPPAAAAKIPPDNPAADLPIALQEAGRFFDGITSACVYTGFQGLP